MPPHIQLLTVAGAVPPPIEISISGGEESAANVIEIWNDKADAFLDTTTAQDVRVKLLTSSVIGYLEDETPIYGPFVAYGEPITDERWGRFRITHSLTAAGASTSGASGTNPIGANAEILIPDLAPQTGVRVEFFVAAPVGQTADATKVKLQVVGNVASSPLAQMVALASGSGVIPADRVIGLRALRHGGVVTADDSDTVSVGRGQLVHDGTVVTFVASEEVFDLEDGDAVELDAAEAYNVTLSLTSAGAVVATRGPKAEAVEYPATPSGNVFLAHLTVESADGIAVTVAQSSVDQSAVRFAEFLVRDGGGLSVTVAPGDGLTATDHRQYLSHQIVVALAASVTSRVWRNPDGSIVDTLTDAPPVAGSDLLAFVTTDTDSVTSIVDARSFVHRALVMDRIELAYVGELSALAEPSHGLALAYAHGDFEIEAVELNLSDADAGWTGGAIRADVRAFAPGAPIPFPAGGAGTGGASIFTSSATDDARPVIAFDATDLRAVSVHHEVRRIAAGTRLLLSIVETVTGPGGEADQEVRVTLHVRRYR